MNIQGIVCIIAGILCVVWSILLAANKVKPEKSSEIFLNVIITIVFFSLSLSYF